jgi:hypothetical protein
MFYYESYKFIREKRYSFAILSVAQALEVFFSHTLRERWLLRRFTRDRRRPNALEELNAALLLLYEKTKRFAYQDMRNLFLSAAIQRSPRTVAEGRLLVEAIPKRPPTPSNEAIAATRPPLRHLLQALKDCKVNELRNEVAHKRAYRPTREEAEQAVKETGDILIPLSSRLRVEFESF